MHALKEFGQRHLQGSHHLEKFWNSEKEGPFEKVFNSMISQVMSGKGLGNC
jgi:hypothetical protein